MSPEEQRKIWRDQQRKWREANKGKPIDSARREKLREYARKSYQALKADPERYKAKRHKSKMCLKAIRKKAKKYDELVKQGLVPKEFL